MSKKSGVAVQSGCYHFVNVYWKVGGGLRFSESTHTTLADARACRLSDGTYVCTVKVTTTMEVA